MQKHLEKETEITQQKLQLELAISNLSEEISDVEVDIKERQHELAHKFRYLLQATGTDFLRNLFEAKNAGQLERNLKFLTLFSKYDLALIKSYKLKANELENKKHIETQRYSVLNELEKKLKNEEALLKADLANKNAILKKFMRTERTEQIALNKSFNDALRNGDIRKAEKFSLLIGKSFIDKRGYLTWPTKGSVSQKFGMIKDQEFRVYLPFKGININAIADTNIKSVAFGKVVNVMQDKNSLYTLLINHGRKYHTLYSNLAKVSVKLDETIQEGQILGTAATTPFYFEIREGLLAKDPMKWLFPQDLAKLSNKNSSPKDLPSMEHWENVK
jgi:murein DD-endopeptidase MepM/ murein hydrolase activator NlpD